MPKMKHAFTLIELLFVVAIIAIRDRLIYNPLRRHCNTARFAA